jgi:hypothetical protein
LLHRQLPILLTLLTIAAEASAGAFCICRGNQIGLFLYEFLPARQSIRFEASGLNRFETSFFIYLQPKLKVAFCTESIFGEASKHSALEIQLMEDVFWSTAVLNYSAVALTNLRDTME